MLNAFRVLAENSGVKPKEVISKLYAAHSEGNRNMGFDIDGESGEIKVSLIYHFPYSIKLHDAYISKWLNIAFLQDCAESNILDLMIAKKWALKYATNAAATVLRVDQIIMAKRAGGPKPRDTSGGMDQDDD